MDLRATAHDGPLSLSNEAAKGWRKTETRRRRLHLHSSATADGARAVEAEAGRGGRADPGAMLAATASPLVLSLRLGATFHSEGREGDVRCHPSTGAPTAWPR
jgi:hypothetical protein